MVWPGWGRDKDCLVGPEMFYKFAADAEGTGPGKGLYEGDFVALDGGGGGSEDQAAH